MSDDFLDEPMPVAAAAPFAAPASSLAAADTSARSSDSPVGGLAPARASRPTQIPSDDYYATAPSAPVTATPAQPSPSAPAPASTRASASVAAQGPQSRMVRSGSGKAGSPTSSKPRVQMSDITVAVTSSSPGVDALTSQIVTLYNISVAIPTAGLEWSVQRRFSEFDTLFQVLSEHSSALPSLPAKTWWFRNMSEDVINTRKLELDVFLKKLVTIPHARHSRELIAFLSVLDHAIPDTSQVPVSFASITDRNFGVNDFVYAPEDGLVITACEDADLISRLDSQLSNLPLPWETRSKDASVVPLGSLNCWLLDSDSGSYVPVSTLFFEHQATSVAWDPVRRHIYLGLENGKVVTYAASQGFTELTVVSEATHHTKKVAKLIYAQSHGDDLLLSIGRDSMLVVYSVKNERIVSQANLLEGWLACLQFDPENDYVYVGTFSGKVLIYDISTPQAQYVHMLLGHNGAVRALDFNAKSGYLVSAGFDYRAAIWQTAAGREARRTTNAGWMINGPSQKIKAVALLPELSMLCTGLDNGTVAVWDTATGDMVYVLNGHKNSVVAMQWRPEKNMLITGARDGKVKFWSMGSNALQEQIDEQRMEQQ